MHFWLKGKSPARPHQPRRREANDQQQKLCDHASALSTGANALSIVFRRRRYERKEEVVNTTDGERRGPETSAKSRPRDRRRKLFFGVIMEKKNAWRKTEFTTNGTLRSGCWVPTAR